jgi:ATP-binding cassette subfamily F protein 3
MIYINNLEIMRGTTTLLQEATATIYPHKRVGLVGRNGCGKSTLFAAIKGELAPENGEIIVPSGWVISSVAQETPGLDRSAVDYVMDGDKKYRSLQRKMQDAEEKHNGMAIAEIHSELENIGAYTIKSRAETLLTGLGFSREEYTKPVKNFSGGWRMRLNLAQALLCPSDLLLLDEPTNHLDLDTVIWLEDWLKNYQGTLIIISHDRDFLDNICTHIIHMENQKLNMYTGNFSGFEEERAQKIKLQQALYEKQQAQFSHLQAFVDKFRYKATKAKQAQSRLKAMEKMERIVLAHYDSPFSFEFRDSPELPQTLVRMEKLNAGYPDKTVLTDVKINLVPGSRIGLLGRNGAGKSTFIKTIAGILPPLGGTVEIAKGIRVGYFAQHQLEYLDDEGTPLSHLTRLAENHKELELRSFLGGFGFSGDKALDRVRHFSGGEKARLVLALIVWQRPNLLLLDEPTNHLDLNMREAIILALSDFKGALIVVSHDRHLLKTTTNEFYLVSEGRVSQFNGDLDDYHDYLIELDKKSEQLRKEQTKSQNELKTNQKTSFKSKEQKKLEAEFREKLRPLKKEIENLDKKMTQLTSEKEQLEKRLADENLYSAEHKEELQQILLKQSQVTSELEEAEMMWMEKSELLEQQTNEFNKSQNMD